MSKPAKLSAGLTALQMCIKCASLTSEYESRQTGQLTIPGVDLKHREGDSTESTVSLHSTHSTVTTD